MEETVDETIDETIAASLPETVDDAFPETEEIKEEVEDLKTEKERNITKKRKDRSKYKEKIEREHIKKMLINILPYMFMVICLLFATFFMLYLIERNIQLYAKEIYEKYGEYISY
ncbi:hypothetical protein LJC58_05875 [Lachnospiraceae bacterium OttesenSCG-928-D06]|nr:hypothetical protein [Lachnospiraceae bacterium OttesenSCG-928-D06]